MPSNQPSAANPYDVNDGATPLADGPTDDPRSHCRGHKPVAMVGAGRLMAAVWATPERGEQRRLTFNVFRIDPETGQVMQSFAASDAPDLARLAEAVQLAMAE